jgi:hypothetical protein
MGHLARKTRITTFIRRSTSCLSEAAAAPVRLKANDPPACATGAKSPGVTNSWPKFAPDGPMCGTKTYLLLADLLVVSACDPVRRYHRRPRRQHVAALSHGPGQRWHRQPDDVPEHVHLEPAP